MYIYIYECLVPKRFHRILVPWVDHDCAAGNLPVWWDFTVQKWLRRC